MTPMCKMTIPSVWDVTITRILLILEKWPNLIVCDLVGIFVKCIMAYP